MARFDFVGLVDSLVDRFGLHRSSFGSAYGVIDGQPVHVAVETGDDHKKHVTVVVATLSADLGDVAKRRLVQDFDGLRDRDIVVQPEAVSVRIPFSRAAGFAPGRLEDRIAAIVDTVGGVGRVVPASPGDRPGLVNGLPRYLTDTEAQGLSWEGARLSEEYEGLEPQWGRGIAFGLVGIVLSALVWAVVALLLDREFWLLAIGAGLLIGYLTLWGVGKTDVRVQVLIGVMTVTAVVLGQMAAVALLIQRDFGVLDPALALEVYRGIIREDPGTLLFALGGGLVGAWYGARLAQRPQFEPHIEIAPV